VVVDCNLHVGTERFNGGLFHDSLGIPFVVMLCEGATEGWLVKQSLTYVWTLFSISSYVGLCLDALFDNDFYISWCPNLILFPGMQ
jgi:hypothetical protein